MSVIDLHYTWLVINSIVGCSNGCKYCFLFNQYPEITVYASPEESITQLLQYPYYDKDIPLCLFPNTDIFLSENNRSYLLKILEIIEKKGIFNDIVLITKCKIPDYIIERFKKFQENGHNIVIYLSYSGLNQELEPNVNPDEIVNNFKKLSENKIPVVHYYRPFIPQNSDKNKIKALLDRVKNYSQACVVTGLMVDSKKLEFYDFWQELKDINLSELSHSSSVWPEESWKFFQHQSTLRNTYFLNSCALNSVFQRPCFYYGTEECNRSCSCDLEQRERCQRAVQEIDFDFVLKKLHYILKEFNLEGYQYVIHSNNSIELIGDPLPTQILIYLIHILGVKVFSKNSRGLNDVYNSCLNDSKAYILRRNK